MLGLEELQDGLRFLIRATQDHTALRGGQRLSNAEQHAVKLGGKTFDQSQVDNQRFPFRNVAKGARLQVPEQSAPLDVRRTPVYATGTTQKPGSSMYGATVEADFDVAAVGQTSRTVRVLLEGKELARATINFAQID